MSSARSFSWLPLGAMLALATVTMGWLLLDFAGRHTGMQPLDRVAGARVEVLEDSLGRKLLVSAEVAALPATAWKVWGSSGFASGPAPVVIWARVTVPNASDAAVSGMLSDVVRYADRVDLFMPGERRGEWTHQRSGEWTPMDEKALWGRETAFPLTVPAQSARTVYLRYEDPMAVWLELAWWPDGRMFHAAMLRDLIAEGCYFGLLLALLFYNAVVWVRTRFAHSGYYLLYLGGFIVYLFGTRSGFAALGWAFGSPWMEMAGTVALPLSGACLAEFMRRFLELPERLRGADRMVVVARTLMLVLAGAALIAPLTGHAGWLNAIVLGSTATHALLLVAALAVWRAGAWQGRYFVLAFGSLFAGVMPATVLINFLPLEEACRLVMVGAALEMLILSLAIADRFARLQQEKLAAQERAVAEAEQRRVIQEAYADELEHEVRERTRELAKANADKDR
ncbi:MAG: 7TM diverse intracellular signaling domain-containing protein, partial [Verrucomicrobiota bacterium]